VPGPERRRRNLCSTDSARCTLAALDHGCARAASCSLHHRSLIPAGQKVSSRAIDNALQQRVGNADNCAMDGQPTTPGPNSLGAPPPEARQPGLRSIGLVLPEVPRTTLGRFSTYGALKTAFRKRTLAGTRRTGQYSRGMGWTRMLDFGRKAWWLLILLPVACVVAFIPVALRAGETGREVIFTAAAVSGIWLDILAAVVWTGAGTNFMGANGEAWTAGELRRLRCKGWHLVNGMKRDRWSDIDHILVGPGGVLVVETKWSADPWPLKGPQTGFMEGAIKKAANQVHTNRKVVADWIHEVAPDLPVRSVAVLWSASPQHGTHERTWRDQHTIILHGEHFRSWLKNELAGDGVDAEEVHRVWTELNRRVELQDNERAEEKVSIPPTLWNLITELVFKPLVGLIAAVYAISLTRFVHNRPIDLIASVAAVAFGYVACRVPPLRRIAIGWMTVSSVYLIAVIAILIRDAIK
jgi:hypothetical protein